MRSGQDIGGGQEENIDCMVDSSPSGLALCGVNPGYYDAKANCFSLNYWVPIPCELSITNKSTSNTGWQKQ